MLIAEAARHVAEEEIEHEERHPEPAESHQPPEVFFPKWLPGVDFERLNPSKKKWMAWLI